MTNVPDRGRVSVWLLAGVFLGGALLAGEHISGRHLAFCLPPSVEPDEPTDVPPDADARPGPPPELRKLTPEEINRIRYLELRGMRLNTDLPDRVNAKIPRETVDAFLLEMEGHPDFRGEKTRRAFRKLTLPQKLHKIAYFKGAAYADRVEIKSDPEVFIQFRKQVMPVALTGCASAQCHASTHSRAGRFQLFNDPKRSANTTYANFVMLSQVEVGPYRLLDRAQPEQSLLLTYMLPEKDVKAPLRHPGDVKIKPVFQSRKPLAYKRIFSWITSLKHPAEDYGVRLVPKLGADSEPDQAAQDES